VSEDLTDEAETEEGEGIAVRLEPMEWAEVAAALKHYIATGVKGAPSSRRDALHALRTIDRVMMGTDDLPAPDDVLGGES
jgi:hypothetical protein